MFYDSAIRLTVTALLILGCRGVLQAQDTVDLPPPHLHPELYALMQDSSLIYLISPEGDTADGGLVAPSYQFSMLYDSLCSVEYLITEWKHNGTILFLPKWVDGRRANAHPSLLSFNSTTAPFTCHTGDTLSFYRVITWHDPRTGVQDTNNFYSKDSLDFAVELVRLSDSIRICVLDSIGMMPASFPTRPVLHGTHPLMTHVKYIVPPALNGIHAFMRVRLYHRGTGKHFFTRTDDITMELSLSLTDPSWADYLSMFGETMFKINPLDIHGFHRSKAVSNMIITISGREARIDVPASEEGGTTSIAVYDAVGNILFAPLIDVAARSAVPTVTYRFEASGTFFVGLFHDGRLVDVQQVSVQ